METVAAAPAATPIDDMEVYATDRVLKLQDISGQITKAIEQHQANLKQLDVNRIGVTAQLQLAKEVLAKINELKTKAQPAQA